MQAPKKNIPSFLLIGTSNAGKTPLGDELSHSTRIPGRRFLHLDFGELLRKVVSGDFDPGLSPGEREFVSGVMNGKLLDDSHFDIARKIIVHFLRICGFRSDREKDVLVLNGIPRHVGQAVGLEKIGLDVRGVVVLGCTAEVAAERKARAERGAGHENRSHRKDAGLEVFRRKLASFERDTLPVVDFYKRTGVPILELPVGVETTPSQMAERILEPISALF